LTIKQFKNPLKTPSEISHRVLLEPPIFGAGVHQLLLRAAADCRRQAAVLVGISADVLVGMFREIAGKMDVAFLLDFACGMCP
jgi:hypothetical protein